MKNNTTEISPLSKISPLKTVLYFLLAGIVMLFLVLTLAYLYSAPAWKWEQFRFPKYFLVSTLILSASGWFLQQTKAYFEQDAAVPLRRALLLTSVLGLAFTATQLLAWNELKQVGIFFSGTPDGSYLYLLSGLHALHLLAGMLWLWYLTYHCYRHTQDAVASLLYFSNRQQALHLELLRTYWQVLGVLWIYLLFFFLFFHL